MTATNNEKTYYDLIIKTIKENEEFFNSNEKRKKIFVEISGLMIDAIDHLKERNFEKDPKAYFVFNALMPFSQGIYVSVLSGNLSAGHMQLRLLIEYLALCAHANKENDEFVLEKLKKTREKFGHSIGRMVKSFDPRAFRLWKSSSRWFHARTHSKKMENTVIYEGVKLWQIIQPAPYDKDDEKELKELALDIKEFKLILDNFINGSKI